jgi:hypothetical protein
MQDNSSIQTIKKLLHFDSHSCMDCGWKGSASLLILSRNETSKLCPECNQLQFSNSDPTLRHRLDSAESFLIHLKNIGEIDYAELTHKNAKFLLLKTMIKTFNLDDDALADLSSRIKEIE